MHKKHIHEFWSIQSLTISEQVRALTSPWSRLQIDHFDLLLWMPQQRFNAYHYVQPNYHRNQSQVYTYFSRASYMKRGARIHLHFASLRLKVSFTSVSTIVTTWLSKLMISCGAAHKYSKKEATAKLYSHDFIWFRIFVAESAVAVTLHFLTYMPIHKTLVESTTDRGCFKPAHCGPSNILLLAQRRPLRSSVQSGKGFQGSLFGGRLDWVPVIIV